MQKRAQTSQTCPSGSTGYTGALQANVAYDPLGRLYQTDVGTSGTTTLFLTDGDALVGEYNSTGNNLIARYVHGSNAVADDPLVWYTSSNLATRRFLHADHLGSIVAITNGNNAVLLNRYDEYGIPGTTSTGSVTNSGRFQYTGQAYIPELGLYYYKARFYSAPLGRFMQTDPIGHDDQFILYEYAGNDAINNVDPTGQWLWIAVGAGVNGAIQAYAEYKSGTLKTWGGVGRIAAATAAGAVGGGAAGVIGRTIVREGVAFVGLRAGAKRVPELALRKPKLMHELRRPDVTVRPARRLLRPPNRELFFQPPVLLPAMWHTLQHFGPRAARRVKQP